ncbi:hypothetical protein RND81_06G034800 [Saponaria officinalis]|uniref:Uncharacterized protein n=1 Tax=Saponaria officinalis TaxID=3572 RepID=A0AAW1K5X5_SAPOF
MTLNEDPILPNNANENELYYSYQQSDDMNDINEEITSFLIGDDFSFTDFDTPENPTNLLNDEQIPPVSNNINVIIPSNNDTIISDKKYGTSEEDEKEEELGKTKFDGSEKIRGKKRKRDQDQVNCHVLAERKRRELLSQLFIALSA